MISMQDRIQSLLNGNKPPTYLTDKVVDLPPYNENIQEKEPSTEDALKIINTHTSVYQGVINKTLKKDIKHKAKSFVKQKFIVGKEYYLKNKSLLGKVTYNKFICKKYIYSINDTIVNMVIMKPIDNKVYNAHSLTKYDCIIYHIKYEPNLYVFSMKLNWFSM
nr:MAG TPA: hypothetical protein [Caudoviricetes sp.]